MPSLGLYEVLTGIENELELERELGVRVFELDRELLGSNRVGVGSNRVEATKTLSDPSQPPIAPNKPPPLNPNKPPIDPNPTLIDPNSTLPDPNHALAVYDFVFLHHVMLSQGGVEMMAKIVTAMKKTPATAPIVFVGERPNARVYVVLGGKAMKKWFPELRCSPGQWAKGAKGEDVLVTYSPEYILRLGPETPAVKKLKLAMWTSLKGVIQKL